MSTDMIEKIDRHRTWSSQGDPEVSGRTAANPDKWKKWVVKLQFTKDDKPCTGTGFYINLNNKNHGTILTAGHNLLHEKTKKPVTDLRILGLRLSADGTYKEEEIKFEKFQICEKYKENPSDSSNKPHDYGVILCEFDENQGGFGFNIFMGVKKNKFPTVTVVAHSSETDAGEPSLCSGNVSEVKDNYLKYDLGTVKGNSGGPAWIGYKEKETVIGIHNYGSGEGGISQATRLSPEVYQQICKWASASWTSQQLQISRDPKSKPPPPEQGLYLRFSQGFGFGRVRLGPRELDTSFDIFPGYTPSGKNDPQSTTYFFLLKKPEGWESSEDDVDGDEVFAPWVRWNVDDCQVQWSEEFKEDCLVEIKRFPPKAKKPKWIQIVAAYNNEPWVLHFNDENMRRPLPETSNYDPELYECSGVSFIRQADSPGSHPGYFNFQNFENDEASSPRI